jgi:hypothetical protein
MIMNCHQINLALKIAEIEGNGISEVVEGWTKIKKVIYMKQPLNPALKKQISKQVSNLRYRIFEGNLHYLADEGFICDEHSIAISFPLKTP